MCAAESPIRRRPKDRKAQILAAARELFIDLGYRNVSMAHIAQRVGIAPSALYRHFPTKSVLLYAVIGASFNDVAPSFGPSDSLTEVLAEACSKVLVRRDSATLWWRESRHLPDDMRADLRDRLRGLNGQYAARIRKSRSDLPEESAEQLAWALQSLLASVSSRPSRITDAELARILSDACAALCAVEQAPPQPAPTRRRVPLEPTSKRESLLNHAVALFDEKGYDATGLDDIGAAAGVTGPNLYSYFDSKADILQTAADRGNSALWLLLNAVLRHNDQPQLALANLVSGYVQLAIDKTILTSVLLAERPSDDLARMRQREYVGEWVALLRASYPDLAEATGRVLVHLALGVINSMAEIPSLQANEAFPSDLAAMALAVLFSRGARPLVRRPF